MAIKYVREIGQHRWTCEVCLREGTRDYTIDHPQWCGEIRELKEANEALVERVAVLEKARESEDEPEGEIGEVQVDIIDGMARELDDLLRDVVLGRLYQDDEKPGIPDEDRAAAFFAGLADYLDNAEENLFSVLNPQSHDPKDLN